MKRQKKAYKPLSLPHLARMAERIESTASWKDVPLPEPDRLRLQDIAKYMKNKATEAVSSGRHTKISGDSGVIVLFAGPSGPIKTLAAAAIGNDLNLALYRVNLGYVVSKYIGETEKNLERTFNAAAESGAILLFDEADALFGKRSEVENRHDPYANVEVNHILQRMECFQGLTILLSNTKESIDQAFIRRFSFVVEFPNLADSQGED